MNELHLSPEEMRRLARLWWLPVCLGVLSTVVGGIVLTKPDHSLKALAVIVGIFVLVDGIVQLAMAFGRGTADRGAVVVLGVLDVIVGILLIRHPVTGVQGIALLIGVWLIAAAVIRAVIAFDTPGSRLGQLIVAGAEGLFGIAIVSSAHIGYATLALLVGLSFIANGIGMIAFGIMLRSLNRGRRQPPGLALAA